jgi:hypothetical protein
MSETKRITLKRLPSGYWHIRGSGPCEWAQPPFWPCNRRVLEASFFPEASERFRQELYDALDRLDRPGLEEQETKDA